VTSVSDSAIIEMQRMCSPVVFAGTNPWRLSIYCDLEACTMNVGFKIAVGANAVLSLLVACGSGGGGSSAVTSFSIGGTASGLPTGAQLILADNGGDQLTVTSNGGFTFNSPVVANGTYSVTVIAPPTGQICTVSNGSGTNVTANVTSVIVSCAAATFTIGGTVSGLASGTQVTLENNGGNALTVTANGTFTFRNPIAYDGGYAVTVDIQPIGQFCAVSNGTGANVIANFAGVGVGCLPTFTVGGTVSGLAVGTQLTMSNNGGTPLPVIANGGFTFGNAVVFGGEFAINVITQPSGQTCTLANGFGGYVDANVTNVIVSCSAVTQYAYVGDCSTAGPVDGDNLEFIWQYAIGATAELEPLNTPTVQSGNCPLSVTVDPNGKYVYAANYGSNTVSQYGIGTGGMLAPLSVPTVVTGNHPYFITVDPTDHYAYVVNNSDNSISQFRIGVGGALTPLSPAAVPTGMAPVSVAVDLTGSYVYVANSGDNTVSQYSIGAGGTLAPLSTPTVATAYKPTAVTVGPSNQYAYVASNGTLLQYNIGAGGALTSLVQIPGTGIYPLTSLKFDPAGQFAFGLQGGLGSNNSALLSVGVGGTLTYSGMEGLGDAPQVGDPVNPTYFAFDTTGRFAYVAIPDGANRIAQYNVGAGGSLALLNIPPLVTGRAPSSIAVTAAR
jgi:6-phosphogluconolactonase (cycloisomerase 2 family)